MLGKLAFQSCPKYVMVREIWKSLGVPTLTYSSDATVFSKSLLQTLELMHHQLGRIALAANDYTIKEAVQGEMGWSSFGARDRVNKLKYLGWLWNMDKSQPDRC